MNLKKAQAVLKKYGIKVSIGGGNTLSSTDSVYSLIKQLNDPLSENEHIILFDVFWFFFFNCVGA